MEETEQHIEMAREMRRGFEREQERLTEKLGQLNYYLQMIDAMEKLIAENRKQQEEIASLQQKIADEKRQQAELEMKIAETRKLMDSIAKKSSEEGMQKAIQTFVNYSKRKTSDKRTYIKNTLLEFTSVNRIALPEELLAIIDCLDDEQTEPKMQIDKMEYVAHKLVENEIQNVEAGGAGVVKQCHD